MKLLTFEEFNVQNKLHIQDWKDRAQAYGDYCAREAWNAALAAEREACANKRSLAAANQRIAELESERDAMKKLLLEIEELLKDEKDENWPGIIFD